MTQVIDNQTLCEFELTDGTSCKNEATALVCIWDLCPEHSREVHK